MIDKRANRSLGQAMVEFALTLPILLFIVLGLLDATRVFIGYSQAAHSLRESLRYAEVLGVAGSGQPQYLNCAAMQSTGAENFFANSQSVSITYIKASDTTQTRDCSNITDDFLVTGDIMRINITSVIEPVFLPFGDFNFNVYGERTIIKEIRIGAGAGDDDSDGLLDSWENTHFGDTSSYGATDDPDGDGCYNGCEESAGTDPNDPASFPVGFDNDRDDDGLANPVDNCPVIPNPTQTDTDGDGTGDACDSTPTGDSDGDGVDNAVDSCPGVTDLRRDTDGDGTDDACDTNIDGDPYDNPADFCPYIPEATQTDTDGDGAGNACDNCPNTSNASQADSDGDGLGDACDPDPDNDGIGAGDSCPNDPNTGSDLDGDGIDDICDTDVDGDGRDNANDNCPIHNNNDQADLDGDGIGNKCDNDTDGDGIDNVFDPCPMQPANNCANSNANITIYLVEDPSGNCNFGNGYAGKTVHVRNTTGSPTYAGSTNGNQGKAQFSNLTTGQSYQIQVWAGQNGVEPTSLRVGASGSCMAGGVSFITYGLSTSLEIWVGYQ